MASILWLQGEGGCIADVSKTKRFLSFQGDGQRTPRYIDWPLFTRLGVVPLGNALFLLESYWRVTGELLEKPVTPAAIPQGSGSNIWEQATAG